LRSVSSASEGRRHHLDDDRRLGDDRRRQVDRRAAHDHIGDGRDLVGQDLRAIDKHCAAALGQGAIERSEQVRLDDRVRHRRRRHQARPAVDELPALRLARVPFLELGDGARPIVLKRNPGHRPLRS
jgi:hypothetical protein